MSAIIDLAVFEQRSVKGKRMSWDDRRKLIKVHFPAVDVLDWKRAFDNDIDMFAWVIRDILKADNAEPSRSGPKPAVDLKTGAARLRQLMGEDYSDLPFGDAFRILAGPRSLSALAAKTGISRSQVRRLLTRECRPTPWEMGQVAKAFKKEPGYFLEYRNEVILTALAEKLFGNSEVSVKFYRQLMGLGVAA